jgi:type IV pilus assembly PilN-like protein
VKRVVVELLADRRPALGRWLLLLGAIVAATSLGLLAHLDHQNDQLAAEGEALNQQQARMSSDRPGNKSVDDSAIGQLRGARAELAIPWEDLLHAIEQVRADWRDDKVADPVTLLAIEPDARDGTVRLTAQAHHFGDAAAYLERLRRQPPFTDVILVSHRQDAARPDGALQFVLQARWRRS